MNRHIFIFTSAAFLLLLPSCGKTSGEAQETDSSVPAIVEPAFPDSSTITRAMPEVPEETSDAERHQTTDSVAPQRESADTDYANLMADLQALIHKRHATHEENSDSVVYGNMNEYGHLEQRARRLMRRLPKERRDSLSRALENARHTFAG